VNEESEKELAKILTTIPDLDLMQRAITICCNMKAQRDKAVAEMKQIIKLENDEYGIGGTIKAIIISFKQTLKELEESDEG